MLAEAFGSGIGPDKTGPSPNDRTVYLQVPPGRRTYDSNDPDEVEEFKRFYETLLGSRVIIIPTAAMPRPK